MLPQSPVTASLPTAVSSDTITTEEEDHLIRSTKKVKNDHDYSSDMAEVTPAINTNSTTDTIMAMSDGTNSDPPKDSGKGPVVPPPKPLSFKQALISSKDKEVSFSEDVESLLLGEEETEETDLGEEEEEQDGIPVIKIPNNLLKYTRKPWENALIVKPIGYPIGYKSLCSKVRPLWDLQGDFSALDIGMGFIVFKFDMISDRTNNSGEKHNPTKPAQQPAYGHWTLVQKRPRRSNTGRRFTDKNQLVHANKPAGPNAQRQEWRPNRFSPLNGEEASTSGPKKPIAKPTNEPLSSQPSGANVKPLDGSKKPTYETSGINLMDVDNQPNPLSAHTFSIINSNHPPPVSTTSVPAAITTPTSQTPVAFTPHNEPNTNRLLPPPPQADLHPNQTRGRGRSSGDGRMDHQVVEHESDGTRIQRSRSPTFRGGSGEQERVGSGPDGGQENGGLE
ncbi:hypothetical protein Vadar_033309 [Vaccinium darrowii]|uniref:Uncharacterized protein n=1 Tax=Vaccinium darrowii TaxID=229202 RepID=A0ACB7ZH03_9ERIC|nr:hypothetical protein Vadar_033309 [Vaccinium darrowii]